MIIYKVTNKINGKIYIGQSTFSIDKRKQEHLKSSRKTKPDFYFHRAIKKYKPENFEWEVIDECDSKDEVNELEKKYIIEFKSLSMENGYNISLNASGGDNFTNHPNKEIIRQKISEKTKEGIKNSNKSWSESHIGKKNGMFGKNHSTDAIKKMIKNRSDKCTGNSNPAYKSAPNYIIYSPYGEKFKIKSMRKFCRDNKIKRSRILNSTHGWKYKRLN